jgi:hypothetical protein
MLFLACHRQAVVLPTPLIVLALATVWFHLTLDVLVSGDA